jgi:hypothetical protein
MFLRTHYLCALSDYARVATAAPESRSRFPLTVCDQDGLVIGKILSVAGGFFDLTTYGRKEVLPTVAAAVQGAQRIVAATGVKHRVDRYFTT